MLAQPQAVFYRAWARTSATLEEDFTNHIVTLAAPSGETFVAGSTKNAGGTYSMLLSKYQASGLLAWETEFTVNDTGNVHVGSIALDASGNILVAGSAYNGAANGYDLLLVKFDDSGNEIWHRLHNGPANSYDFGAALACDDANDDVYVTGGAFASLLDMDAVVIRYDSSGAVQWAETWDNTGLTDACGTIALVGGMAIATGFTQTDAVTWEYAALRFDMADGDLLGAFVTNQGGTTIEQVTAVAFDDADNIYITGALGGSLTNLDIKTVKLDADLNIQWTATWSGTANLDDVGRGITVDGTGNVYVVGYTTLGDDTRDALLLKYASSGTLIWAETRDAEGGHDEFADVALADDGMPFVGGYITQHGNRDFYAALYDTSGTRVWSDWYNGRHNDDDEAVQLTSDGLGNFLLAGPSTRPSGREVLTVKYARHTLVLPSDEGVTAPFVENRGQVLNTDLEPEDDIRYYSRQMYPNVYIFDNQLSYVFAHVDTVPESTDTMARIDLSFIGLQPNREGVAVGLERQGYHHNYYLGHIPEGRERVALENKVLQPAIYQHIDALYGQGPDGLFIRLICQPGSDPDEIRFQFAGHTDIWVDTATGALVLESALESLVLPAPEAMTIDDEGVETEITAWQPTYVVDTGGIVSITTGSYDTSETLVVKVGRERGEFEALTWWSTYYGWTNYDTKAATDIDEQGNVYTCGQSRSVNFPVGQFTLSPKGGSDWAINKFTLSGVPVWFTMVGGPGNGAPANLENAHDISVGVGDFLYVGGAATEWPSDLFKNDQGGYQDKNFGSSSLLRGAIIKMQKNDGGISWSTYFGDSGLIYDEVMGVKALANGGVVAIGYAKNGLQSQWQNVNPGGGAYQQTFGDMYIGTFGANDNIVWSTKFGPSNSENNQSNAPTDIVEDGNGNLFVVGVILDDDISNDNFPTGGGSPYSGGKDGFVAKFSGNRALTWSTYLGGTSYDYCTGVACNYNTNDIVVLGTTYSSQDFPIVSTGNPDLDDATLNGFSDLFLARFSNTGTLLHSRFFGGDGIERTDQFSIAGLPAQPGNAISMDPDGNIFITGAATNGLPVTWPSPSPAWYFPNPSGGTDAFVAALASNFKLEYCTYLGGSGNDVGTGIDVVNLGANHYIVMVGRTQSTANNYPTAKEALLSYYSSIFFGGEYDGVITKIVTNNIIVSAPESTIPYDAIEISPNPCTDLLRVRYGPQIRSTTGIAQIYDLTGRILKQIPLAGTGGIDTSLLQPGAYVLSISLPEGIWLGKFIKIK